MTLKKAIRNTVEYAAKFGTELNKKEIEGRLISKKQFSKEEIEKVIDNWGDKVKKDIFYKEKFKKALNLAKKIESKFNNILFLGISGSVATEHPKKNDDIDFLVITKTNKLWQTRLSLRWWIYENQIPHRRYKQEEKRDEFCFNLWLDENYLKLPNSKQNLKNSVDLVLLKPLINKDMMYEKFLLANDWAKQWVATPYANKIKDARCKMQDARIRQNNFNKVVNYLYFWPQYWYMKKKIKKERVSLYQAFFHR